MHMCLFSAASIIYIEHYVLYYFYTTVDAGEDVHLYVSEELKTERSLKKKAEGTHPFCYIFKHMVSLDFGNAVEDGQVIMHYFKHQHAC